MIISGARLCNQFLLNRQIFTPQPDILDIPIIPAPPPCYVGCLNDLQVCKQTHAAVFVILESVMTTINPDELVITIKKSD